MISMDLKQILNSFTIISIFILVIFMFILQGCDYNIPSVDDAVIKDNQRLYVAEGEVCENAEIRLQCQDDLYCKRVVSEPYIIGVCYKRNYTLEENITYIERYSTQIN